MNVRNRGGIGSVFLAVLVMGCVPGILPAGQFSLNHHRPSSPGFFAQGARLWSGFAGYSADTPLGRARIMQWTVDTYQTSRRASLSGWTIGHIDARQTRPGYVAGPIWGMRRHLWQNDRWSTFVVGTFGPVLHQHRVTPESLRFNFDIQGGFGLTYRLGRSILVQVGCRWYHLSNARVRGKDANLGFDAPMYFFGVMSR
jgi:hypothetical protein